MTSGDPVSSPDRAADAAATVPRAGATAGQLLRQARERAGMHLASLAAVLKVPTQRLEALEADQYDQLPGMAFVRGLAASMARTLRLDVDQVLGLLPRGETLLKQDRAVASMSRHSVLPSHGAGRSRWTGGLAVLIVLLLAAAAALLFVPELRGGSESDEAPAAADTSAGSSRAEPPSGADAGTSPAGVTPSVSLVPGLAPVAEPVPSSSATAGAVAGEQGAQSSSAAAPAIMADLAPQAAMALPTTGTVVFSARGEAWIEVLDANRLPLLRRTLQAGERVGVSGAEPLSVIVGNAREVQVEVRGQAFALAPYLRGQVARFQVK
ncbi:MAG: DUF4115 domain-containing protein [Comamonas sp.]